MTKRYKTSLVLISIFISLMMLNNNFSLIYEQNSQREDIDFQNINAKSSAINSFIIDNNGHGDYTWEEVVLQSWCSGSGIQSDPYVIENLKATDGGFSTFIEVRNSEAFFTIRNCEFFDGANGIILFNVKNAKLVNNNLSLNKGTGLVMIDTFDSTISNNVINDNNQDGIFMQFSDNNEINHNSIVGNLNYDIFLQDDSDFNLISNNDLNNAPIREGISCKFNNYINNGQSVVEKFDDDGQVSEGDDDDDNGHKKKQKKKLH